MQVLRDVSATMSDGTTIFMDVYLPDGEAAVPALVSLSPYGRKAMAPGTRISHQVPPTVEAGHTERLVEAGYAHVIGDVRGSGDSSGRFDLWGPDEQRDTSEIVAWVARQPWCTGDVGMVGISYFAMVQPFAAADRAEGLRAIFAFEPAGADLYRDVYYHGGLLNRQLLSHWPRLLQVPELRSMACEQLGTAEVAQRVARLRQRPEYAGDTLVQQLFDDPAVNPVLFDALMYPEDGPFYHARSSARRYQDIEIPACFGSWWSLDFIDLQAAFRGFANVRSTHRRLVVGPPVFPDRPHWQFHDEVLRWYGRWLKGEPTGVEDAAPILLYVMGAHRWREAHQWPLPQTRWTRFYLHEGAWLHEYPPVGEDGTTSYEFDISTHSSAVFETSVLLEDTEVTGPLALHFTASCSTDDTAWIVSLYDVHPDGTRYFLGRGWLKASHRRLDVARSLPWQPVHPHTDPEPIEPGRPTRYAVEMMPIANVFRAGHRIALEISSDENGFAPRGRGWLASLMPGAGPTGDEQIMGALFTPHAVDRRPKRLTIHHGEDSPGFLLLPIVEGNLMGTSTWMRPGAMLGHGH